MKFRIKLREIKRDSLIRNSFLIMMSSLSIYAFGFIFWMVAGKLYSPNDIGLATSLISSIGLVILISRLGLDYSLVRFLPENGRSTLFGTIFIVTTIFSFIAGVIFLAGISIWSPSLFIAQQNAILYLLFLVLNSVVLIGGTFFIAVRRSQYYLYQNLIINSIKLLLIFPLIFLGALGIFVAYGVAYAISAIFSTFWLNKYLRYLIFDKHIIFDSIHFSAGNYFISILLTAPTLLMPIIILNTLGSESAGHYYIPYAIASLLFVIPSSFGMSLFVEGSYGGDYLKSAKKSILAAFSLLIPCLCVFLIFGNLLLSLIDIRYLEDLNLLELLAISSIFITISNTYFSIKRIQKKLGILIFLSLLLFILLLGLSILFIIESGIIGVGYAWIISYGIVCIIIAIISIRDFSSHD